MAQKIYLSGRAGKGLFALVDDEDFDFHSQFVWHLHKGYAARDLTSKETSVPTKVFLHNEVTNFVRVDHKNRVKLDCQKENLRETTQKENMRNKTVRPGVSGYIGVFPRNAKYAATVDNTHYGCYSDAKTAALVVDHVRRIKWAGSIFTENFPDERLPDNFDFPTI